MQPTNVDTVTPIDAASTTDSELLDVRVSQPPPLAQYINEQKLSGRAANDAQQFALTDFLFEHMRQRANAQPEPPEDRQTTGEATTTENRLEISTDADA